MPSSIAAAGCEETIGTAEGTTETVGMVEALGITVAVAIGISVAMGTAVAVGKSGAVDPDPRNAIIALVAKRTGAATEAPLACSEKSARTVERGGASSSAYNLAGRP